MKRGGFLKRKSPLKRNTKIRVKGHSTTTEQRDEVQRLLREICLKRDKVCVLSGYMETGACGPMKKDGKPVYQAEHLNSRSNAISFADSRNCVLLCSRHHIYWKPQHSKRYWEIIEEVIGPNRWEWLEEVQDFAASHRTYKLDYRLAILALEHELKKLSTPSIE